MYFNINDASYWYQVHGEGTPLVMLHGFTGSSSTWSDFIRKYSGGMKIITVDLPGHGKTETPSIRTMEDCCRDLHKLFGFLGLHKFHLAGYSMGGRTALSFSVTYPDLVETLVLESASPGLLGEEKKERLEKDARLSSWIEREGITSFVDYWENIPLFESQKRLPASIRDAVREERLSQSEKGLAQSLQGMGTGNQPSWWDKLASLNFPVLLLAGEYDEKFIEINRSMAKKCSAGSLTIVEDAGHAIHVEKPEIFGKLVSGFIKKYS
ncbi:2-succinyl-6-hydroxy-2,4-cyclohexadiene-1-carboxylate synthase [Virgibacillus sediminis]|uniref:Putative 2-succinyl-6-hydroxy-2,4-cyclohexadiene-1-carboxylate synthase n=1 Tax=Virgibacillus sediminis TaxID=202260 RepID=A0ABV7A2E1_9BACI